MTEEDSLPLSSHRVLDLTDERGIFCGKILSDLGADVIKIEPPQGSPARLVGPFFHNDPSLGSLYWFAYNTNHKSITLNLETIDGRQIFRKLVGTSDFVLESFPPGYPEKLGLGYSSLSQINPPIIMTSITPFGQEGPYAHWKAPDIVLAAMGGQMYMLGDPDRPPLRIGVVEQSYLIASSYAAAGTMIAYYHRLVTGEGQHVDVSGQESVLLTTIGRYLCQRLEGYSVRRTGNYHITVGKKHRKVMYECKDGYVLWTIYLGTLGRNVSGLVDWMNSEGKAGKLRQVKWTEIGFENVTQKKIEDWEKFFGDFLKTHTKAEIYNAAAVFNFMAYPVNTPEDLLVNSQLAERNYWTKVDYPELEAAIIHPGPLYRSSKMKLRKPNRAPLLGEHNEEIYKGELGFSEKDVCFLKEANVI